MVMFIHGNANEDEILKKAGIDKTSTLISALPSDADNLFVVLSARQLNENLDLRKKTGCYIIVTNLPKENIL